MRKLIIVQTATPDYRKKFYSFIKKHLKDCFELFSGDHYFESTVKSDTTIDFNKKIKNHFLFGNRFLFQTGVFWRHVTKDNVLVLEMNPRILSNWIILILRRALRRPTVLWGHAWPRSGSESKSDKLRNLMRLLGDKIIVYTATQKRELKDKMPKKSIECAPNALYYKEEMVYSEKEERISNIIYVGRLTKNKKAFFLVKAFSGIYKDLDKNTKLIIIGDGEEKQNMLDFVKKNNLQDKVLILGHIGDYDLLKEYYSTSLLSVSPGYLGLSVTQSFGFGVPMLISKEEKHSPEIEAVKLNLNAKYFKTDDLNDLRKSIIEMFANKKFWIQQRAQINESCQLHYSIEAMADSFIKLVE